jgi:hypothetical protein
MTADTMWKRVDRLEPGDIQLFAGRRLLIDDVIPRAKGRKRLVIYANGNPREWSAATEVVVLDV